MELTKKKLKLNEIENILKKTREKSLFKDAKNEIYVIEPTRKHLEMHQEILSTTDAINQLEFLGREDNIKLNKLKKELEELENEYKEVKKQNAIPGPEVPAAPGIQGTPVVSTLNNKELKPLKLEGK